MNQNYETQSGGVQAPLHRRIAESLSNLVSSGKLKPGDKLPSERQIARQFEASRATVRTALSHLEQSGLINRRERRSAIVSIRRDVTPYLRIACSHPQLAHLFSRLGDLHILPPRCQIQQVDLLQPGSIAQIVTQPATGADVLICGLENVNFFRQEATRSHPISQQSLGDPQLYPTIDTLCRQQNDYVAVPLGINPQVLYYNRDLIQEVQVEIPGHDWHWDHLEDIARQLTHGNQYGFQFRPTFAHLAALMVSRGGQLYQENGRVAAQTESFESTIRFIYDLVHVHKVTPILAKADQINLFAEGRCGLALDGAAMYNFYREQLGDALGVTVLPGSEANGIYSCAFVAVVLAGEEDTRPAEELILALLTANSQRLQHQVSGALPVRKDLLNDQGLQSLNLPAHVSRLFLQELSRSRPIHLPADPNHRQTVETIFLELWLGLDNMEGLSRRFRDF
jgi:DNA-binding transcriptional regulator YhcF (GntR family)